MQIECICGNFFEIEEVDLHSGVWKKCPECGQKIHIKRNGSGRVKTTFPETNDNNASQ